MSLGVPPLPGEVEDDGYITVHPVMKVTPGCCGVIRVEATPEIGAWPPDDPVGINPEFIALIDAFLREGRIRRVARRVRHHREALADRMIAALGGSWDGQLGRWHQLKRLERRIRDRYPDAFNGWDSE